MATSRKSLSGAYTTRLAVVGMLLLIGALAVAPAAQAAVTSISRGTQRDTAANRRAGVPQPHYHR
jgi:hypothetical protein